MEEIVFIYFLCVDKHKYTFCYHSFTLEQLQLFFNIKELSLHFK